MKSIILVLSNNPKANEAAANEAYFLSYSNAIKNENVKIVENTATGMSVSTDIPQRQKNGNEKTNTSESRASCIPYIFLMKKYVTNHKRFMKNIEINNLVKSMPKPVINPSEIRNGIKGGL